MVQAKFKTDRLIEIPDELIVGVTVTNVYSNSTIMEFRTGGASNTYIQATDIHFGNATVNATLNSSSFATNGSASGGSGDLVRLANGNFAYWFKTTT